MQLSLRSLIGISAAFATMAVVIGSAMFAPAEPSSAIASTCPSKMKHGEQSPTPSGA